MKWPVRDFLYSRVSLNSPDSPSTTYRPSALKPNIVVKLQVLQIFHIVQYKKIMLNAD